MGIGNSKNKKRIFYFYDRAAAKVMCLLLAVGSRNREASGRLGNISVYTGSNHLICNLTIRKDTMSAALFVLKLVKMSVCLF